jgi:signal peptidase I
MYEDRPARKTRFDEDARPVRKSRSVDEDYPVRAARGYDEELPARKKPRAQSPRPVERFERPRRDDFEEFDRPVRRASSKPVRKKKKKEAGSAFLYWAIAIVLALLIGFGVRTFGFEMISVRSDAMRGTLIEGEVALVKKSVYYTQKPARGDIVAVNSPDGVLIRRVVALPGETIEIKGGVTYVNDEPLDEAYVSEKSGGDYPLTTIPDGGYFVMSDNRLNDDDSRSFGLIKNTRSLIIGKVDFIVWPLTDFGTIQ